MNKNAILFAVAGLVLIGGIGFIVMQNKPTPKDTMTQVGPTTAPPVDNAAMDGKDPAAAIGVVEITLDSTSFKYSQTEIKVKKGDTVKLSLNNVQGFHDWVLDGYENVKTKQMKTGESETIEFIADKAGTFEYYCSVGDHRAKGMVGNLIVEE